MEFNADLAKQARAALARMTKDAFAPPPAAPPAAAPAPMPMAGGAPPAGGMPMAGGAPPAGGAPAGGMPMDPSMMGGGMPMDPSMMGGGMPMDPSMMGAGGAAPMPPGAAPPTEGTPITVTLEDLVALFEQVAGETGGGGGEAPNEPSPDISKALDKITQRLDAIEKQVGGGGAGPGGPGDVGVLPGLSEMAGMPEMGAGAAPFAPPEPMPPMPEPMVASASEVMSNVKSAKKIGNIIANLRKG